MQAEADVFEPGQALSCPTQDAAPEATGRALVPLGPAAPETPRTGATRYPGAPFLAHLIAVDRRLPQTRPRGRAAPADAAAVYGAALQPPPARTGRRLRRSA